MINIVFDYDGTLHDSIRIYAPAIRKAQEYLVGKGLNNRAEITDKEATKWIGATAPEMWGDFAPDLPEEEMRHCSRLVGDEMVKLTLEGKAMLYPRAEYTLMELKRRGFTMLFLSNCKTGYMEAHREYFKLDRFFSGYFCSEAFGYIPKYEIFDSVKERWQGDFIIVGDRSQDIEIAERNGLTSIGCLYGYGGAGELQSSSYKIKEVEDMLSIAKLI